MSSQRGYLITLEGGEGAGKSSAMDRIVQWARNRKVDMVSTREPGGTPIGERIRSLLLDPALVEMHPMTELMLMFAARAQHVREVIVPALERGRWVLSDRFTDASMAYQGYGRGLDPTTIETLATLAHPGLKPDLTLLLDVPVAQGLARAGGEPDRFEADEQSFLERVRQGYRALAAREPERFAVIDASVPIEQVTDQIIHSLEQRWP